MQENCLCRYLTYVGLLKAGDRSWSEATTWGYVKNPRNW
jgi:hypothetical protein